MNLFFQDIELTTITAHDGDVGINNNILFTIEDKTECENKWMVLTYLNIDFKAMVALSCETQLQILQCCISNKTLRYPLRSSKRDKCQLSSRRLRIRQLEDLVQLTSTSPWLVMTISPRWRSSTQASSSRTRSPGTSPSLLPLSWL